ncbi:MAG: branched-chain amino acid transporter permease [Desulfomicrobiaceae bacterium]|jgi:branched-chain amino acid transport system permease protein|nr:branched-chain amino acid transporter permease [Desulfomicrobiaceae bacterium]MBZ4685373.1 branched-chain amino acid transporter permease [Desulfomicrobiaceae bacterium]MDI3492973.1 branched-chain amino acid transport system permease protein [Desulfomicrobiaceae bacterium]MDK2873555.1 branched-chain amino acid transport system permease protein [Desulfomicrobiaceae bacterium]HCF05665.1 branched-chain amino acid ABC transporter permease [Desulfomicrobiaceae bacterium]
MGVVSLWRQEVWVDGLTRSRWLHFFWSHRLGLGVLAAAGAVLLFPWYTDNPYTLGLTNRIALMSVAVVGLNLFMGCTGQISLGHAAFMAVGAYISGILTVHAGWSPWLALVVAVAAAAGFSLAIGVPLLRLSGHALAMATLACNVVVHHVLLQEDRWTGGPSGLAGIPPLTAAGWAVDDPVRLHFFLWFVVLVVMFGGLNLVRSLPGRGLMVLAADEVCAACLGVPVARAKVVLWTLSAVLAAVAGSLFAHTYGFVSPDSFGIFVSTDLAIMVVLGGMGSVWGSVLGAAVIVLLPEFSELAEAYKEFVHGGLLVAMLLVAPQGMIRGIRQAVALAWWRAQQGRSDAAA